MQTFHHCWLSSQGILGLEPSIFFQGNYETIFRDTWIYEVLFWRGTSSSTLDFWNNQASSKESISGNLMATVEQDNFLSKKGCSSRCVRSGAIFFEYRFFWVKTICYKYVTYENIAILSVVYGSRFNKYMIKTFY